MPKYYIEIASAALAYEDDPVEGTGSRGVSLRFDFEADDIADAKATIAAMFVSSVHPVTVTVAP